MLLHAFCITRPVSFAMQLVIALRHHRAFSRFLSRTPAPSESGDRASGGECRGDRATETGFGLRMSAVRTVLPENASEALRAGSISVHLVKGTGIV